MSQLLALGKVDLCVAVTRAEHELALMVPMHKAAFGGYQSRQNGGDTTIGRSRFIPTSMLDAFDAIAWRSNGGEVDEPVVPGARGLANSRRAFDTDGTTLGGWRVGANTASPLEFLLCSLTFRL